MGCGSPFGGFVSPFVGFCIWICFIFFLQKSQWPMVIGGFGYGFTIERRKIKVLGFREFGYGFTILISPQPYQTPNFYKFFSKLSLYVGNLFSFFLFFFFCGLTHTHYSIFSLCLVSKKIKGKKNIR